MPLYMDHHKNLEGLTAEAVAEDHKKDLQVQDEYGVKYHRYWFNEQTGSTSRPAKSFALPKPRIRKRRRPSTAKHTATSRTR